MLECQADPESHLTNPVLKTRDRSVAGLYDCEVVASAEEDWCEYRVRIEEFAVGGKNDTSYGWNRPVICEQDWR